MRENGMDANAVWKEQEKKTGQECQPTVGGRAARRDLFVTGVIVWAVLLVGAIVSSVCAQTYPDKPIRLILPTSPGGTTDIVGRIIAPKLSERLGQPVVIENRPGAGGSLGAEFVAKSRPDGYTILLTSGDMGVNASLYTKTNFDTLKDLVPISTVAQVPLLMSVRPALPVKNLKEFVEYAKANPGKLTYASSGVGAMNHLAVEHLKSLAGINVVHAPYKATGPGIIGVMGGEVDMIVSAFPSVMSHAQAGKIKPIAMLSAERSPSMPDVPTAKEVGFDNYEFPLWFMLLAPAGTPRDIVNRLHAEWNKVAAMPDTKEMIKKTGCDLVAGPPPEYFAKFLKEDVERWAKIIKEANIPKQ